MTDDELSEEEAVAAYLDGRIDFESLAELVGRRSAETIREAEDLLDRGDEIADELTNQ